MVEILEGGPADEQCRRVVDLLAGGAMWDEIETALEAALDAALDEAHETWRNDG